MKSVKKLVLLASLVSSVAIAEAGNGGGVNGPDLSGRAIPVRLDRELEVGELNKIIYDCSRKFAAKTFAQIYGREVNPAIEKLSVDTDPGQLRFAVHQPQSTQRDIRFLKVYGAINLTDDVEILRNVEGANADMTFERNLFYEVMNSNNSVKLKVDISDKTLPYYGLNVPYFGWDAVETDRTYNDFGELVGSRRVVRNLKFYQGDSERMRKLINTQTNAKTSIVFDFRDYRDCLLNGVQQ